MTRPVYDWRHLTDDGLARLAEIASMPGVNMPAVIEIVAEELRKRAGPIDLDNWLPNSVDIRQQL